jgi:hypothetical protein
VPARQGDTPATPSGWTRDGAGYARHLPGGTAHVKYTGGQWFYVVMQGDERRAIYSRPFQKLSQAVRAVESVVAVLAAKGD